MPEFCQAERDGRILTVTIDPAAGYQAFHGRKIAYGLGLEGGHSRSRILHAGGDATGAEVMRALVRATVERPDIDPHLQLAASQPAPQACLGCGADRDRTANEIAGGGRVDRQVSAHAETGRIDASRIDLLGVDDLVQQGQFDYESGCSCARSLLSSGSPPTAIFASNDPMAMGVLSAAHELGFDVPRQLSVAGFDDIVQII